MWLSRLNLFIFTTGQEGAQNPVGKLWDVLEPKATSGRRWLPHMPEAHFRALIPALALEQCWALDAVLFHTTASLQTKHDLFSKGGVNYSSLRVTGELRKQRKRQFLIIPTDWGAQTPAQTSYASIHFLMTSALESPEILPKGTSQKGLEEGRVDIGLKKRISIPRRRPQFPSKGRTILTYLIPGSRSFFSSSFHGRPSGRGGLSFILQAV